MGIVWLWIRIEIELNLGRMFADGVLGTENMHLLCLR